jgi:hypothetical protein
MSMRDERWAMGDYPGMLTLRRFVPAAFDQPRG